ncbi:MAG: rod shape-determining protein MreD [Bacteroidetes bacterium]|nr:MAG: rod shape-determining protein MreD [Bacteroidota bacterium]
MMSKRILTHVLQSILFIAAQVLIFNHINLGGYVNPYIYIIFILMLPLELPGWLVLINGFLLGLTIDIFTHVPGLHASATVFTAFIRPFIINRITTNKEIEPGIRPSLLNMGQRWFLLYAILMITSHHIILFFLEVLSFKQFFNTLSQALLSSLTTLVLAYISQYLFYSKRSK